MLAVSLPLLCGLVLAVVVMAVAVVGCAIVVVVFGGDGPGLMCCDGGRGRERGRR